MSLDDHAAEFGLTSASWRSFCKRIARQSCVPVVGSRVRDGVMPLPEEMTELWAAELDYPLVDRTELAMVAEFARNRAPDEEAVVDDFMSFIARNEMWPRGPLELERGHPLRTLAELPFELYVTTTYDDLLVRALRTYRDDCEPIELSCQWDPPHRDWMPAGRDLYRTTPSLEQPVVFHLHGRFGDPSSLVLTETNHMNLTAKLHRQVVVGGHDDVADGAGGDGGGGDDRPRPSERASLLPPPVRQLLANSAWFFVGYGAADRNLRGLLYALNNQVKGRTKQAVAVQLQKGHAYDDLHDDADQFLTEYFTRLLGTNVEVVIGDAGPFLAAVGDGVAQLQRVGTGR